MVESKVVAQSGTAILTGLVAWGLTQYVPAFHTGLPPALAAVIPVFAAWLLATYAGWKAPHTHRPGVPFPPASSTRAVPPSGAVTVKPPRGGTMPGD